MLSPPQIKIHNELDLSTTTFLIIFIQYLVFKKGFHPNHNHKLNFVKLFQYHYIATLLLRSSTMDRN